MIPKDGDSLTKKLCTQNYTTLKGQMIIPVGTHKMHSLNTISNQQQQKKLMIVDNLRAVLTLILGFQWRQCQSCPQESVSSSSQGPPTHRPQSPCTPQLLCLPLVCVCVCVCHNRFLETSGWTIVLIPSIQFPKTIVSFP